jgi:hypothetical protein
MPTMSGRRVSARLIEVDARFTLPDLRRGTFPSLAVVSAMTAMTKEVEPDEGRAQHNPNPVVR